jgi:PKD repeat protein
MAVNVLDPLYTYTTPGTYTVSFTVTGPGGSDTHTEVDYIVVNDPTVPPTAAFSGAPLTGIAPLSVDFTDASTGSITGWSWDFGDTGTSTEQNPSHEYTATGAYTVSLTTTGPGGSDTLTEVDYVVVGVPGPVAAFTATPLTGVRPLLVAFTDASMGPISAWDWDFGDTATSTLQNPSHTYLTRGTYTVSLTVTGPGGSEILTQADYIEVLRERPPMYEPTTPTDAGSLCPNCPDDPISRPAMPVTHREHADVPVVDLDPRSTLDDGGFERQVPGAAPTSPWAVTSGSAHAIHPLQAAGDLALPMEGSQWAEVSADGSTAATPPSNPGGAGSPPVGTAGISQSFTYDPARPQLYFHAAFVLGGPAAAESSNDFMSVDLTDGTTTHNLYYADTFSDFPNTSARYELPATTVDTVSANLAALFPTSDASTIFTISVQVGNGGDGLNPSMGYVDGFAFAPEATATIRNGAERNALCLANLTSPALGTTWTTRVDHGNHPQAAFTILLVRAHASNGVQTPFGEILVSGSRLFKSTIVSSGTFDTHAVDIPLDVGLAGLPASAQAIIVGGEGPELCNAIDIVTSF